jgi:predicted ester cyclase
MSEEGNRAIVRRYRLEMLSEGNLGVADEIFPEQFIMHGEDFDLEKFKQLETLWLTAFPDLRFTIEDMVAEGEKVVERFRAQGTHQGDLFGIAPTGKKVEVSGIYIHRIMDGRIVEIRGLIDLLGLMEQLGVIPPLGEGGE